MVGYDSEGNELFQSRHSSVRNSLAVVPYKQRQAQVRNQKATQHLEKIQRSKLEKEEQRRLEEERKKLLSVRRKQKLKEQLEMRKVALGVGGKSVSINDSKPFLYQDEDPKLNNQLDKKLLLPSIVLIDLNEEEDRDR